MISEIVQHLELAQIKKKKTYCKNLESALCPSSRSESCSGCWLTVSERSLAPLDDSMSLGVGAVGLLYLEQPLCIHWRPAVCLRGAGLRQGLVFCDTFFNAFVFQKWQCEVY